MNCALALRMLDAHIDNELDAATVGEIATHVATCAACTTAHNQRVVIRSALHTTALRHAAPQGLRKSILRSIEQPRTPATRSRTWRWWEAAVLGASTAVFGALGGWWFAQPHALDVSPDYAVARHVASLSPEGPRIDVASSDHHVVRPWFQGRLEFAPMVRDLSAQGFDLIGARVDHLGEREAVAVLYRLNRHIISVFSWRGDAPPTDAERSATIRGFNVRTWSDTDMHFAAVSDTDSAELQRFIAAYRGPQ